MTYAPDQPAWARGVILCEMASKSNRRRFVRFGTRPASIKSAEALKFEAVAMKNIDQAREAGMIPAGVLPPPYAITARVTYRSERPDLDAALLLDALQKGGVIDNDRHVRELHAYKTAPDKNGPKVEWEVRTLPAGYLPVVR